MKKLIVLLSILFGSGLMGYGQVNIVGIHQLVDGQKQEFKRQNTARNNQAVVNTNENYNKTLLEKLHIKYAEIQDRYSTLATAVDAANIGLKASPIVQNIIRNQRSILREAQENPAMIILAIESEKHFVEKANMLVRYLIGLVNVIGDINQMKQSDRFILFNHIILELRELDGISRQLAMTMAFRNGLHSLNPFDHYINKDKAIVEDIMRNWEWLKD